MLGWRGIEPEKFRVAGFSTIPSETVAAPRVLQCPVRLEACVRKIHGLQAEARLQDLEGGAAVEVKRGTWEKGFRYWGSPYRAQQVAATDLQLLALLWTGPGVR